MPRTEENILPFGQLRRLVEKILRPRVKKFSDVEDISQNVFHRSWKWAKNNENTLTKKQWKRFIAKVTFNEINRFYSKKTELLSDDYDSANKQIEIPDHEIINPQFILEIAEQLRNLSFRQRLSLVLHKNDILAYLRLVLSPNHVAKLLEIDVNLLISLENEIPLTEQRIKEVIEQVTSKECRSSIRDERCKARKLLKRGLYK